MVRNRRLSKSISDASWGTFLRWVKYYATIQQIELVAVSPHFTSQDCSGCGTRVKKTLSVRAHICPVCGLVLNRDRNAAMNVLNEALHGTAGHTGTGIPQGI